MNDREFQSLLAEVRHPGRYAGGEVNSVHKDPARVGGRLVLVYPDLYELAMSYLGLQVLYQEVNRHPDLWAERAFAPDLDFAAALERAGAPLASLESRTPLQHFDVVGFTLQHELTLPEVLFMLDRGRVPPLATERQDADPIVLAGGPCATNPEPLAEALDAVFLGDAEGALGEIVRTVGRLRRAGRPRTFILDALAEHPGVYLPGRYRVRYHPDGRLAAVEPLSGAPARIVRRALAELDTTPPPDRPLVPAVPIVHDRLTVEIQRGCTRGCRFCQAGMINRPVRQRGAPRVLAAVANALRTTGFDQVGFLSLSAGDHPQLLGMLEAFFDRHGPERIAASLPSLRAETLTPALAELLRTVRKPGFTIAPEAGTERLRRVINKDLTEADVLRAALGATAAGWRLLKLYFMVGLPTETEADREGIVGLVERLRAELRAAGHRAHIHVGISVFVPKPHTPFQWEAMIEPGSAARILERLRTELRRLPGVKLGWSRSELSGIEGVLARGDRRLFGALRSVVRAGARLSGWSEHCDVGAFETAFATCAAPAGAGFYLRARDPDELLPWEHLELGPSRAFLLAERDRARTGQPTPDCARGDCGDCGACDASLAPRLAEAPPERSLPALPLGPGSAAGTAPTRVRLHLKRCGRAASHSHLEFMVTLQRALRRAGWPLAYSQGFHPKPRMTFGPACPLGVENLDEPVDLELAPEADPEPLASALARELPAGMTLESLERLSPGEPTLGALVAGVRYRLWLGPDCSVERASELAREVLARASWSVQRGGPSRGRSLELRPSLLRLEVGAGAEGPEVLLEVATGAGAAARPLEVAAALGCDTPQRVLREALLWRAPQGAPGGPDR